MIFQLLNKKPFVSTAIFILLIIICKKTYAKHNFENCIVILEAKVNFYHGVMNSSHNLEILSLITRLWLRVIKSTFKVGNVTRSTQIIF
jgi:hypothetical protein